MTIWHLHYFSVTMAGLLIGVIGGISVFAVIDYALRRFKFWRQS